MPSSKKKNPLAVQARNFKFLFFPDCPEHMEWFKNVKAMFPDHIGILHDQNPERKPHYHVAVHLNGPMMMQTICNAVGMVNELGQPDAQFIRFLDGRLNGFLVYLTHLSEPQKEQYSASALFGSSYMLAEYGKAATKFVRNELDMSDCVLGCLDWISNQRGYIIRWSGLLVGLLILRFSVVLLLRLFVMR